MGDLVDPARDLLIALPRDILDQRPPRHRGIGGTAADRVIVAAFETADDCTQTADEVCTALCDPTVHVDNAPTPEGLRRPGDRDPMVPVGGGRDGDGLRNVLVVASNDLLG